MLSRPYSDTPATTDADMHTYLGHPAMLSTPQETAPVGMNNGSAVEAVGTVSYAEYQRVVTNEAALAENVATLKAVVLQLAGQLHQANEELQLLQRCSPRPLSMRSGSGLAPASTPATASPTPAALEAPHRVQQELLERKNAVIETLRQQLRDQDRSFHETLNEVAGEKNAVIERLALDLDDARRALRRR